MPYEKHTWLRGETITAENLNHLEDGIVGEQTTRASQDQFINDRIDQIIAPTGEAPNPTEITDARIGVDDTVYNTLGTAIRTQVGDLKNALIKTTGAYNVNGTATQAVRYTETIAVSNITFEPFTKYSVTLTTPTALSIVIYGYVKNANDETLLACNIPANETSATYVFYTATRLENCKVVFQSGVNNTTVSACVTKDVYVYDDLSAYEQTINYTATSGYLKTDGTIASATTDQEVYTDAIDVEQLSAIRFALIYPGLIGSKVLWLKAGVTYKNGTFERKDITTNIGDFIITDDMKKVAFTYRTYGDCSFKAVAVGLKNANVSVKIGAHDIAIETATRKAINASIYSNPLEFLPCWDHLFVSRSGTWVTIPHESLFHVRLSRLFGAKVIEANLAKTSDGVFIVNHLSGGKFGNYFHHVDNSTDISNIAVSSVTWQWIIDNVRYNSRIAKYQTRPPRLEEFLAECKQQNLIPLVTASDAEAVAIVRAYMGNGYIAYDGNRNTSPDTIIFEWKNYSTKEEILAYCESIGKPMIYGFGNITDFTDNELLEIISLLHDNGYLTACSYTYDRWSHYASLGIDANGATQQINRLTNGNICNLESLYGFNNFVHTNASETDGVLTFTADGTISPDIANDTLDVCAVDFELVFDGSITIPSFGEHVNATTITGDGVHPYFQATPILGGSPKVTIAVASGTKIYDMKYKATRI